MSALTRKPVKDHDLNDYCEECLRKKGQIDALRMLLKNQEEISKKLARAIGEYERIYGINNYISARLFDNSVLHVVK